MSSCCCRLLLLPSSLVPQLEPLLLLLTESQALDATKTDECHFLADDAVDVTDLGDDMESRDLEGWRCCFVGGETTTDLGLTY